MNKLFKLFVIISFAFSILSAEEKVDDWKFTGGIQIRSELDGRDFSNLTYPYSYTGLRTRIAVEKSLFNHVSFFAQIQDSRVYGEETSWTANMKNLDLHQGYVMINNIFDQPLYLKGGRFEMSYSSGRIIQSSQWSYIGGSFDGLILDYKTDAFYVDLFGFTTANSKSLLSSSIPDTTQYPYPSKNDVGMSVWGFWGNAKITKDQQVNLFTYYEFNGKKADEIHNDLMRFTSGLNYELKIGDFSANVEFGYQFGTGNYKIGKNPAKYSYSMKATSDTTYKIVKDSTITDKYGNLDIASYMAFIGLKYNFSPLVVSVNADIMSGTKYTEKEKVNVFYGDYASKHTFFGYMDYFSNLDKSTKGRGVNDYFLRLEYLPKESPFSAQLDGHYFLTNVPYQMADKSENSNLGQEVDLVLKYKALKNTTVEWGGSVFLPGDVSKDVYSLKSGTTVIKREDPAFWTYLMLRVFM